MTRWQQFIHLSATALATLAALVFTPMLDVRYGTAAAFAAFVVTVLAPIAHMWWRFDRREIVAEKRRETGLCGECGYDLRATPGRCPECGSKGT